MAKNEGIQLVRFVSKYNYLLDDIKNGFALREHNVSFMVGNSETLRAVLRIWEELELQGGIIGQLIEIKQQYSSDEEFDEKVNTMVSQDESFKWNINMALAKIRKLAINMKCFTELRDNQKIHPSHTGYFGDYGISVTKEWALSFGADRVTYVDSASEYSKRIAVLLAFFLSTGKRESLRAAMDMLCYFEISEHQYEFEWRIVGNYKYLGEVLQERPNTLPLKLDDIVEVFVTNDSEVEDIKSMMTQKSKDEGGCRIPKISFSDSLIPIVRTELSHNSPVTG